MNKILLIFVALLVSGCATTEYQPYVAKDNIFEGKGGTMDVINGIEYWNLGSPPRKYILMGIISDSRGAAGIPAASLKTDITAKAKAVGGDAVILLTADTEVVGSYTSGNYSSYTYGNVTNTYGGSPSVALKKAHRKFAVIKYMK